MQPIDNHYAGVPTRRGILKFRNSAASRIQKDKQQCPSVLLTQLFIVSYRYLFFIYFINSIIVHSFI